MIPRKQIAEHPLDNPSGENSRTEWKNLASEAASALSDVETYLPTDRTHQTQLEKTIEAFPLRVPQALLARGLHSGSHAQMLKQFLPNEQELENHPDFTDDPVGDLEAETVPGLIHKYHGRVLLITTGSCPVHCRYCFRRAYPYSDHHAKTKNFSAALRYIKNDSSITEVILSGGDPLSLSDTTLSELSNSIAQIEHVQTLRIHTRYPIAIPERVNHEMLSWLKGCSLNKIMVVHSNHPEEIDETVIDACARLRTVGVELLNQSVLLSGVNDDAETLVKLSKKLHEAKILPYYIHLLDRVTGTHHFEVDSDTASALIRTISRQLPGYLVPRLCREVAGAPSKIVINNQNQ